MNDQYFTDLYLTSHVPFVMNEGRACEHKIPYPALQSALILATSRPRKFEPRRGALLSMEFPESSDKLIRLLLPRLERISVDSYWAHRASGVRGALAKMLEEMEMGVPPDQLALRKNILIGFEILKEAVEEY